MKLSSSNALRLINQFERVVRLHEMKGAQHPNDWDAIEEEYKNKKKKLVEFCIELILQ